MFKPVLKILTLATMALTTVVAHGQDSDLVLEEIIVTGVAKPTTKFESTMSVTALPAADVINFAPRSTAEIFRNIPGIQSESSSGDANANVKVRGMPISSGGARYLSFQEDGFPMMAVGDTAFATADSFLRFDTTVQAYNLLEAVPRQHKRAIHQVVLLISSQKQVMSKVVRSVLLLA